MNGMDIWFFWKLSTIYFVTKRYPTVSSRLFPITKYHCKVKSMGKGLYEALTWYCGFSTVPVMVRFLCWEKLSSWLSLFQSLNKHFDWRIVSNTARKWFALIMKAKGLTELDQLCFLYTGLNPRTNKCSWDECYWKVETSFRLTIQF